MAGTQTCQSSGGFSTPQKSAEGLSNSSPTSHDAPSITVSASAVLAVLLWPFEISSTDTGVLFLSCTGRIVPHPCALTTTVSCLPENFCSGSRLVITTGIRRDSLVLRLAFLHFSSAVPSLELTLYPASAVPTAVILKMAEEISRFRHAHVTKSEQVHGNVPGGSSPSRSAARLQRRGHWLLAEISMPWAKISLDHMHLIAKSSGEPAAGGSLALYRSRGLDSKEYEF